jgi:hypothetical protein
MPLPGERTLVVPIERGKKAWLRHPQLPQGSPGMERKMERIVLGLFPAAFLGLSARKASFIAPGSSNFRKHPPG